VHLDPAEIEDVGAVVGAGVEEGRW